MPSMRSFNDLELRSNFGINKLKLICLASCEPSLCSIDWYFSWTTHGSFEGPLTDPKSMVLPLNKQNRLGRNKNSTVVVTSNNLLQYGKISADRPTFFMARREQIIYDLNNTKFSWFSDSSLTYDQNLNKSQQDDENLNYWLFRQQANVISQLELTYHEINHLLKFNETDERFDIKCRLNNLVPSSSPFGYQILEQNQWFPQANQEEFSQQAQQSINNNDGQLNLSANDLYLPDDNDLSSMNNDNDIEPIIAPPDQGREFVDEMQISIVRDKPPKSVELSFANQASDNDHEPTIIALTEAQLLELADPNSKISPIMNCFAKGNFYPSVRYRWTFTDVNQTIHSLLAEESQFNLRQFLEFRQRSLNVDPTSAYGVDVISGIVGNYSCTITNAHGSKSATLSLQIRGRPLCKLSLGNDYTSELGELMANLRCSIYSVPALLETVWFRNGQQILVNQSSDSSNSMTSNVELPVIILNKQQNFMLNDLLTQLGNFKCIARNPFGYSEACELNPSDKQLLLNFLKQIAASKSPILTMLPPAGDLKTSSNNLNKIPSTIFNTSQAQIELAGAATQPVVSIIRFLSTRLNWLLGLAAAIALAWILMILSTYFMRRYYNPQRKLYKSKQNPTNWRFASTIDRSKSALNGGAGDDHPFNQIKLYNNLPATAGNSGTTVNYYGGSNGDSEHDMIQSSQSSHYEDFVQHQQRQLLLQQSQPIYSAFNGNGLLVNRQQQQQQQQQIKSSLSSSSTGGDSSTSTGRQVYGNSSKNQEQQPQQLARLKNRDFAGTMLLNGTLNKQPSRNHYSEQALTLAHSNVPLVNGSHNSRINLDQQLSTAQRYHQSKQTFVLNQANEPIYDDVIYNQMIL